MIQLAEIFQNNMILQRRKTVRLWGKTDQAQNVFVYLNGNVILEDMIEEDFELFLPPMEAAESAELEIIGSTGDQVSIHNVDIGEVWIAGGQSNMEFMLEYDVEADQIIPNANDQHYRFYNVGEFSFEGEREENLKCLAKHWDKWTTFEPTEAPYISAAATFFAMKLREKLQVPVGIVGCNWGGTSASCWIPKEDLEKDDALKIYLEEYRVSLAKIKNMEKYIKNDYDIRKRSTSEQAQLVSDKMMKTEATAPAPLTNKILGKLFGGLHPMGPHHEWRPCGLYETMVKPIAGYTASGVIFYQGCSDENHARLYSRLFTTLIRRWRSDWRAQLPFLFVQLAPFEEWQSCSGKNFPIVRAQQKWVADHVADCYMASIMDAGSRYDIHPKTKRKAGERLAGLALHYVYGDTSVICDHPQIDTMTCEGDTLTITFKNTGSGLVLEENDSAFSGLNYLFRVWIGKSQAHFTAELKDDKVILTISELAVAGALAEKENDSDEPAFTDVSVAADLKVSFANRSYCIVNLKSKEGLPVLPMSRTSVQ